VDGVGGVDGVDGGCELGGGRTGEVDRVNGEREVDRERAKAKAPLPGAAVGTSVAWSIRWR
jgi:hypothetical protein